MISLFAQRREPRVLASVDPKTGFIGKPGAMSNMPPTKPAKPMSFDAGEPTRKMRVRIQSPTSEQPKAVSWHENDPRVSPLIAALLGKTYG